MDGRVGTAATRRSRKMHEGNNSGQSVKERGREGHGFKSHRNIVAKNMGGPSIRRT